MLPKIVFTDIDGVWTDGGMYYGANNEEFKKFNTSDSAGVLFLKTLNIPLVIITGEDTQIVRNRAKKLNITEAYYGIKDKVSIAEKVLEKFSLSFTDAAFIGDDINDLLLLKKVGYSSAPLNAPVYIKNSVNYITSLKGGDGAFRDFVEHLLTKNDILDLALSRYYESLSSFNQ